MVIAVKRTIYPLVLPSALIILSAVTIAYWNDLLHATSGVEEFSALLIILPKIPYFALGIGIILGWRYNDAGLLFGNLVLIVTYFVITFVAPEYLPADAANKTLIPSMVNFMLPLNLIFCATLTRRRILTPAGLFLLLFIFIQGFVIFVCFYARGAAFSHAVAVVENQLPDVVNRLNDFVMWVEFAITDSSYFGFTNVSTAAVFSFGLALLLLLIRIVQSADIRLGGLLLSLIAVFLGITSTAIFPAFYFYFGIAGIILIITTIESSISMAYIDELTGLSGRRSLNETMKNLGKKYTIAMIDVDHFKKFNDTYGHKAGDQVLRMIAARLGKMNGNAKTFRYGGEEFTAIFTGKGAEETRPHIERFRMAIASTPFVIRARKRPKQPSKRPRKPRGLKQKHVKVTVSIGLASPGKSLAGPEKVLKAADKKLYRAKRKGRNRIEQ